MLTIETGLSIPTLGFGGTKVREGFFPRHPFNPTMGEGLEGHSCFLLFLKTHFKMKYFLCRDPSRKKLLNTSTVCAIQMGFRTFKQYLCLSLFDKRYQIFFCLPEQNI